MLRNYKLKYIEENNHTVLHQIIYITFRAIPKRK